ncbi:hypothetical protein DBB29_12280 [Pandoraea cepalis]|uniref:Uncharacterized protein n=1 Tax=Pandoraea cepalis TaxID=2508294 RepID=A0AAW7MHA9_9BURK|nr:hypothetical protein [Pandoraea cepalis]MDN4572046.1 hypothetical protein [Pandoraea cepalis]MDN4578892.1 hypothetical protein [Pandoraea cepalis]
MQFFALLGVLVGEFALRFVFFLYLVPLFFVVVGLQHAFGGARMVALAGGPNERVSCRKQVVDGAVIFLFGLALAALVYFRSGLWECARNLL